MTAALKPSQPAPAVPVPADPLAARLAALAACRDRYQHQINATLAAMELAQAHGDEAEVETALVEITCATAARTCAVQHLERLQPTPATIEHLR